MSDAILAIFRRICQSKTLDTNIRNLTVAIFFLCPLCSFSESFTGLESTTIEPVTTAPGEWGLQIVFFDVGQADAILLIAPNNDTVLIDTGETNAHGVKIAGYLTAVGLKHISLLYSTHYDRDHIGGVKALLGSGIRIQKALDQGPSAKRVKISAAGKPGFRDYYNKYLIAVGDLDGDNRQGASEPNFIRHKINFGDIEYVGLGKQVEIRCVAVRGDTEGIDYDENLDPATASVNFNENPGSIALLVRLGKFEFYTAGDQTSEEWKGEPWH